MSINCMNCGAMLIGGETMCPVCRQPVASAQANTGWQPPPQNFPPGAEWQQRPIGPPPLGGGEKSLRPVWVGTVGLLSLLLLLGGGAYLFYSLTVKKTVDSLDKEAKELENLVSPIPTQIPLDDANSTQPTPGNRNRSRAPISGGVLNGKATSLPKPPYPAIAKAARASGTVVVQVTVDETGKVTEARAVSGHPLLRAAAEQAARQARFTPTKLAGQPVKVTGVVTYNFTLEQQ